MRAVDYLWYSLLSGGAIAILIIIWSYAKGLRDSPRDMWFLFIYKFIEYSAYGAINIAIILWLTRDCGLGDISAGSYIAAWSMLLSVVAMVAGALVDTIGIKKTLMISVVFLLISRFFMAWMTNPAGIFVLGFIPMAIGFAIVGPLVSVAIKRYTSKEGAALGFGLFYVVMNIAFAVGAFGFDWFRSTFGERDALGKIIDENAGAAFFGMHFSTYQIIFIFGFIATCISLIVIFFLREGIEVDDDGNLIEKPQKNYGSGLQAIKQASIDTGSLISRVVREKYFWIFIGMLSITIFARMIFFHFNYTFPKYGIRVLGEGAPIGSIFGVLNPMLIVFLVPAVAYATKKVSSYKMMIFGATISAGACFIALIPAEYFTPLTNTVFGELIFVKWLGLAPNMTELLKNPPVVEYWSLIIMITAFTVGEAIWSPRLMQFTAEIAPKGKEGTYIALSVLPWFAAKFVVGPMSGMLVKYYTPVDEAGKSLAPYANHHMVWVWVGGMAMLTPIGLLFIRKYFKRPPDEEAAEQAAE